ncbi:CHAT domain-containing protein [Neolewinella aurantiaca]|uniref:CHAT domain-containing protein n=1 Tax=Neolewinella aurantiaca TaxID=2602767 RepID=A0A5C7FPB4_9BACT|nr:CHAT domain-containing protein [Neolewinella aurantiaca]TXF89528.1 CHAT domain-containing protein [Neolewinella aurantiaca]
MIINRPVTGWLFLVFLTVSLLAGGDSFGQTPQQLEDQGKYDEAAQAFVAAGGRMNYFRAGEAWYEPDSLLKAAAAFLNATQGENGALVEDSLTGLALHKTGLCFYRLEDDEQAIKYYRQAVQIRDKIFPGPHNDRAKSRKNLATSMRFLGNLDSAAVLTREAIAIYEHLPSPDTTNWLRGLNELGDISLELQDMQVALSSFLAARPLVTKVSAEDAFNYYYLGARIYLGFEDFDVAIRHAQRAVALAEQEEEPYWLADVLTVLAGGQRQSKRPEAAKRSYLQAAEILEGDPYETESLRLVYLNLASLLGGAEHEKEALRYLELANTGYAEDPTLLLLEVTKRKGIVQIDAGKPEEALVTYEEGLLKLGGKRGGPGNLVQISPDSISPIYYEEVAQLLGDQALALTHVGRFEDALSSYDAYFNWLDILRNRVNSDASRRFLSQNLRPVFDRAIGVLIDRFLNESNDEDYLWRALALSERAKAYSLLTSIQRDRRNMPKRESELRARIATLERSASKPAPLEAARLELDRLLQQRKTELPETEDFTFREDDLLEMLRGRGSDLMAFHLGAERGHLFVVNHRTGGIGYASIEGVDSLTTEVEAWREAIDASAYQRKSLRPEAEQAALDEAFQNEGLALVSRLFYGKHRYSTIPAGNVLIVPDGALCFLPFSCLPVTPAKPPLNYGAYHYFAKDRNVSYAYSTSVLLAQSKVKAIDYDNNLLAFAPSFGGDAGSGKRAIRQTDLRALKGLEPLQHNREEVESISTFVPGSLSFYGVEASRKRFLETAGSARIVHLSSHGTVNAADPRLSFIAFSQLGDSLELEELLYFNDLSSVAMEAELVVLSACETSLGEYVPGETALSLASAFTASGARSTLTTLWAVDDAATKELMVNFYHHLTAGNSRAEALAIAQRTHREGEDYAHPYYWSAMTLYGAGGPVILKARSPFPWMIAAGGGVLVALLSVFFLRGNRKKR